jgi:hypothetical protein
LWDCSIGLKSISVEIAEAAIRRALEKESHAFVELWDSLSGNQREICLALARDPGAQIFSGEIIARYKLGSSSSIHRTVTQLCTRGILLKKNNRYELSDPFLALWLMWGG